MVFVCLNGLLSCILCFHVCTHVCFHVILSMQIIRTFKTRIPIQTIKKWHNVRYCYVSYVRSVTSNIWRAGAWSLKPSGESIVENHIYDLVKPNSIVKARTVYRGGNVCCQVFLENGNIDFKSKIWNFNLNFQT